MIGYTGKVGKTTMRRNTPRTRANTQRTSALVVFGQRETQMIGIGTIVNVVAIIAGAVAGSLIRGGLPEKFKNIIMQGVGLAVLLIGLSGALQGLFTVAGNGLERQ